MIIMYMWIQYYYSYIQGVGLLNSASFNSSCWYIILPVSAISSSCRLFASRCGFRKSKNACIVVRGTKCCTIYSSHTFPNKFSSENIRPRATGTLSLVFRIVFILLATVSILTYINLMLKCNKKVEYQMTSRASPCVLNARVHSKIFGSLNWVSN